VKRISGDSIEQIRRSIRDVYPDPRIDAFLESLVSNAPDRDACKFVLAHIRGPSVVLEGSGISYQPKKGYLLLGEDASACGLLLRAFEPVIGLFPKHEMFEPACGAALAAVYENHPSLKDYKTVVCIACGGVTMSVEQLQHHAGTLLR
jgi:hypothetical protein